VTCLKKGVMGLVTLYASHELEAGIAKATDESKRKDSVSGHAWDEGWAFYYGADEGASAPWEVATKRDGDFPSGTQVSTSIVPHFNKGLIAVRKETYDDAVAKEARDTIYQMWAVTYLRAALKYLQISEKTYQDKAHSEGYAYFMAVDGWVHSKGTDGAEAAKLMRDKLDITQSAIPDGSYCAAKAALEKAYPAMGLSCDIMGTFKDNSITCEEDCDSAEKKFPTGHGAVFPVKGTDKEVTCNPSTTDATTDANQAAPAPTAEGTTAANHAAPLQSWLPSLLALVTLLAA